MEQYAGIDVSLESVSVCVVDSTGRIVREAKLACEPEALITWFGKLEVGMARIGLEAGPLSQWLYARMREAGLSVELLETRHVRDAFKAMPVKTDRTDARGIAQLMRLGWFRSVHCKSLPAQELRAILTARKLVQTKRHDLEMSLRGILRGFGLKVGQTTPRSFEARVRELVDGHPTLTVVADAMLLARAVLVEQLGKLQKRLVSLARQDTRARLLMSTPGVGVLVALTYVAAIDDPARFRSSKAVGAHFGLTPKKYQSGETDVWRCERPHRALRGSQCHLDPACQRFVAEELGDAGSEAYRHAQGKGRIGPQARCDSAPNAGQWQCVRRRQGSGQSIERERSPVRADRHQRPEQVPSPGRWIRSDRKSGSSSSETARP